MRGLFHEMSATKDLCFSFCWLWIHSKQNITSLSNAFKNLILSTRVDLTKFLIFSARTGGEGMFVFPAKIQLRYKILTSLAGRANTSHLWSAVSVLILFSILVVTSRICFPSLLFSLQSSQSKSQ